MSISVLVVDDHRTMAEALTAGLTAQDDLHPVAMATSGSLAVAIASSRLVDVAIVDADLGQEDGIQVGARLRRVSPTTDVIHLFTSLDDVGRVTMALRPGVLGWVGKDEPMRELLAAVRGTQHGQIRLPPVMLASLFAHPDQPGPLDILTLRQKDILQGLVDGFHAAAIAERLFLSKHTVRTHIQQLLRRLGAHSTLEAVAIARTAGMKAQSIHSSPPHA